jgi:hypothetical protein
MLKPKLKPEFPVYIISKSRYENCLTAKCFVRDNVDFTLVVEPQEFDEYKKRFDNVIATDFSNLNQGSTPARNFVRNHAIANNAKKHWLFDDNIRSLGRLTQGRRIACNANIAMKVVEDFCARYENIALAGFNYRFFVTNDKKQAFTTNCHVYSAMLIDHQQPYKFRLKYNEDTDLCLQILTNNMCTVLFHAFYVDKLATMTMKGGNTTELYKNDGRKIMAQTLAELWPDYVTVKKRYNRYQHVVRENWRCFKQPLIRKTNFDEIVKKQNYYNLKLIKQKEIKSKQLLDFYNKETM